MNILELHDVQDIRYLVAFAASSSGPVVVVDGERECLVVMSPRALESLLFEGRHPDRHSFFEGVGLLGEAIIPKR